MTNSTRKLGHLFKRDVAGKYISAKSKRPGIFWLETLDNGKRLRQRLEVNGQPVRDLEVAKREQLRIRAPFLTRDRLTITQAMLAAIAEQENTLQTQTAAAMQQLTIADAWAAYENAPNRNENSEDTRRHYLAVWQNFRQWLQKHHPEAVLMSDVSESIAGDYVIFLRGENFSANTFNKHVGFLRMLFNLLARRANIVQNPFADIARKKLHGNSRRALMPSEISDLLKNSEGELQILFLIGICTGLRLGDCATLRWDEINLEQAVIRRVMRKTQNSSGKEIIVGIPKCLMKALNNCLKHSEYVLPVTADKYSTRKGQDVLTREINKVFVKAGIQTQRKEPGKRAIIEVGFHSLRHSYISFHAVAGTPQVMIQENAGHENPAMTEHYTHIPASEARKMASVIDATFSGNGILLI